jgi:hypothetical protein
MSKGAGIGLAALLIPLLLIGGALLLWLFLFATPAVWVAMLWFLTHFWWLVIGFFIYAHYWDKQRRKKYGVRDTSGRIS